MDFFTSIGETKIPEDNKHKAGADLIFNNNYIECVCATPGAGHNYKKLCDCGYKVFNSVVNGNSLYTQIYLRARGV